MPKQLRALYQDVKKHLMRVADCPYIPIRPHKFVVIPVCSLLGILTLVSTFFISADLASNSYALDGTNLQSEVTAEIDGTHYVTLSASDVTFSITPTNSTASDKKQVDVELSTNVSGGASLYLSTSSSKNALYLNGDTNSTSQNIASASSTTTYDNMVNNTWAYSTDDINYQGVPTLDSPVLLSDIDGISTGTNTNGVVSATIPIYYAAKVDTSIPSGSYANSVTYLAVVDGGIITNATLTKIEVDGAEVENMQPEVENTLEITTNLMTNTYGTPRVYYETTSPAGYQECGDVVVSRNESGYMTIICKVTPTQAATGVTLHVVPKGSSDDRFCTDNTYQPDTSDCKAGEWRWGSFTVSLPDIVTPAPDINRPATSWDDLEIMQHMTPEICASASEGDTKQLIDWRDGKTYWVAKLKDGNCWMTQNLELDLSTDTPLTSELSDVTSSWTPTSNTYTSAQSGSTNDIVAQSWDLGKYVWKTPNSPGNCQSGASFSESSCAPYWQDVSSWAPMTEYHTDGVTYNAEAQTYDAHYLVGNYYSWMAATAGTGTNVASRGDKAPDSICPKGFELPTSGSSFNSTPGSFYHLLMKTYGLSSNMAGGTAMHSAPLFFVRSGVVYPINRLDSAGDYGYYLSSVVNYPPSSTVYILNFSQSYVGPTNGDYRMGYGFSVRCVALSN